MHAGGMSSTALWKVTHLQVFAVKLPGRESRAKEPFFQSMQQIVDEVVAFGAFTSFAVADHLKQVHNLEPVHIFLSGASAPYSEMRINAPKRSNLSDDDFLKWMSSIGGTPPELLANPEVLKLFVPALKADLHVVENYRCNNPDKPLLSCSVTCFDGKDDIPHDLQAWKSITSGDFTTRMLDGSHFYLKDPGNEKILLDYITKQLETSEIDYL
ncbi:S-acyl fatty acid synthase thioesterase, medium chain [Larimichthys crocea]|uniref:Uncharacterized protein n=1 Tax=Larimichthys crocea TaxID=215358 RepID=A0ACD3RGI7_LARCR|nr:S-acyl fatty acid synthase thioesterase, medium chain [Larimichthys crocea]